MRLLIDAHHEPAPITGQAGHVSGARVLDRYISWVGEGWALIALDWEPIVSVSASEAWRTMGLLKDHGWVRGIWVRGCGYADLPAFAAFVKERSQVAGRERWVNARLWTDLEGPDSRLLSRKYGSPVWGEQFRHTGSHGR